MKPAIFKPGARRKERVVRWIGFLALVALLAMASLPVTSGQRDVAATSDVERSGTWHG